MPNPFDFLFGGGSSGTTTASNPTPGYPAGRFAPVNGESFWGVGSQTARARQNALDADRVRAEGYARGDEEARIQQEALQSIASLRMQNPNMPGQQLMASWLTDPEGGMKLMKKNKRALSTDFISKATTAMTNPEQVLSEGQSIVRQNATGSYDTVAEVAKPMVSSVLVAGGTPEAKLYGLDTVLKPGERAEVQITKDKNGTRISNLQRFDSAGVVINNTPEAWNNTFMRDQAGKAAARASEIRTEQRGILEASMLTDSMLKSIEDPVEGAKKQGVVGWIARTGEAAAQQARAIADEFPQLKSFMSDPKAFDDTIAKYPVLAKAASSAVYKSNLLNLTYVLAKTLFGQNGRDLSDRDVKNALEVLGAGSESPTQMRAVLLERLSSKIRGMDATLDVDNPTFDSYGVPRPSTAESLIRNRGLGYILDEKGKPDASLGTQGAVKPEKIGQMTIQELNTLDWDNLTPEQLQAATARIQQIKSGATTPGGK